MSTSARVTAVLVLGLTSVLGICLVLFRSPAADESGDIPGPRVPVAPIDATAVTETEAAEAVEEPPRDQVEERAPARAELEPIPIDGGWLISGRVVREAGGAIEDPLEPVWGAGVHLKAHPRRTKPEDAWPPRHRRTGADGRFAFAGVRGSRWIRLEVDVPPFARRTLSAELGLPDAEDRIELGDILLEPGRRLGIDVVDPRGEAVEGAEVVVGRKKTDRADSLENTDFRESRRLASEQGGGRYVLERAPTGLVRIQVLAAGYSRFREYVHAAEDEVVVIGLDKGLRVSGSVLTRDGRPIPDAALEVDGPNVGAPPPTARTDATGGFLFDILSEGEYSITVSAAGYVSLREENVTAGLESIVFSMTPEAVFSGRVVVDDAEGTPSGIANAKVTLRESASGQTASSTTDARGLFALHGLAAGRYLAVVDHEEFAPALGLELVLDEAERITERTIRLRRGPAIVGSVLEAKTRNPIPLARVTLELADATAAAGVVRSAETDTSGRCELEGLVQGTHALKVSASRYLPGVIPGLTVRAEGNEPFTVLLEPGVSISGRVTDRLGNPVAGASLDLRPVPESSSPSRSPSPPKEAGSALRFVRISHRGALKTRITDVEGRYTFSGLSGDLEYSVSVSHWKFAPALLPTVGASDSVDITLRRGATIRGRVIGPRGGGIPSAKVKATLEDKRTGNARRVTSPLSAALSTATHSVRTGADGRYSISGLRKGVYTVAAQILRRLPGSVETIEVAEDGVIEGVDIVLEPGESLAGRVLARDGRPVAGARIRLFDQNSTEARTDLEGRFRLDGLPPTPLSAEVSKSGFVTARVSLTPVDKAFLVTLERSATIRGAVVEARSGLPVAGARILLRPASTSPTLAPPRTTATTSRVDGTFVLRGLPEGRYQLEASHDRHAQTLVPGVSLSAGKSRAILVELSKP